jgi:gamma-glutamylcysteine synthetase
LYDEVSLQNVLDMTADWTREEREMLRRKVSVNSILNDLVNMLSLTMHNCKVLCKKGNVEMARRNYG